MVVNNFNYLLADNNNKLQDYILDLDTKDFNKKIITLEKISQIKTDLSLRTLKNILEGKREAEGCPRQPAAAQCATGRNRGHVRP